MKNFLFIIIFAVFTTCRTPQQPSLYNSQTLDIQPLTKNTAVHISYLKTKTFGNVPCNGLIYFNKNEAIIFDTPSDNATSIELINWVEQQLKCSIKAVVINHFHIDCLGGIEAFHERNIPSYANEKTITLAMADSLTVPQNGFVNQLILDIGDQKVVNQFIGEGHTQDNIVSYIPSEKVLFGGCMVKGVGSGKGNLADANTTTWSNTALKTKATFPKAKYIIPGHGKVGGKELLDYTSKMFEQK